MRRTLTTQVQAPAVPEWERPLRGPALGLNVGSGMPRSAATDIVVIGAGPYGLSVAAHLLAQGRDVRVFGRAMESWTEHMPVGMMLKSEGFASSL